MRLESILNSAQFHLPAINSGSTPYVNFAENSINNYLDLINSSAGDLFDGCPEQIVSFRDFADTINTLGKGIIEVIRHNNNGYPDRAYTRFKELMNECSVFMTSYDGAISYLKPGDILYRAKFVDKAPDLKSQEYFFHTPFELRHMVQGTRFAPPGFPSLYLTNALIVGYLETRATSTDSFQSVKFEVKKLLSFIDLDYNKPNPAFKTVNPEKYDFLLQIKGLIFPLLFCCYSQKNSVAAAPQEYIIPQLLLRWVRESGGLFNGIKYPSTRIDNSGYHGNFYNLIIPPVNIADYGYCTTLKKMFDISEVCGLPFDSARVDGFFSTTFGAGDHVNPLVKAIMWNGSSANYELTEVGQMEFYLKQAIKGGTITF